MPLDQLSEIIEMLRERIGEHGQALRKNETLTRYVLIDPLFRALGWDTEDPSKVMPEYHTKGRRADYALLDKSGKPLIMVEAKRLGQPLEKAVEQGISYCLQKGTLYFAITDGQRWEIYETHKPVPLEEKRIVSFDLGGSASDACRRAPALWRSDVLENKLENVPPAWSNLSERPRQPAQSPTTSNVQPVAIDGGDSGEWKSLPDLTEDYHSGAAREAGAAGRLRFPDGTTREIKFWWQIVHETAIWLHDQGHFTEQDCPIRTPGSRERCVVDTEPVHPGGKRFKRGKEVGALFVETTGKPADLLERAAFLIRHVGLDPAHFHVRSHYSRN